MSKPTVNIAFKGFWHRDNHEAVRQHNPLYQLLSRRFDCQLEHRPDFLIYSGFGDEFLQHTCTRIFYTGENIRPDWRHCDYAFTFDHDASSRHYRLPLYRLYPHFDRLLERPSKSGDVVHRKFCNFVYSNASARERIDFFRQLSRYRPVDSGGRILNNLDGPVGDKLAFLAGYKFTIAFENSSHPGYTTEKLLDPLVAGSVPIYWGNPEAHRDFEPGCFINAHDFANLDDLVEYVKAVDEDDERYLAYLNAPVFPDNRVPDSLSEEAILDRFEAIFRGSTVSETARTGDGLRYWLSASSWNKRARRWMRDRRGYK